MKKTLITLAALAMASVAQAEVTSLAESKLYVSNPGATISQEMCKENAYTMILILDWEEALAEEGGLGYWDSSNEIKMGHSDGFWWNHGLNIFQGKEQSAGNLYVHSLRANGSETSYTSNNFTTQDGFLKLTDDYNVQGKLALTYTFDFANKTTSINALKNDGTLSTATSTLPDWTIAADKEFNYISLGSISSVFDKVIVFDSVLSAEEIIHMSALAIPEPTTATLSLLALAGLAARRRRK